VIGAGLDIRIIALAEKYQPKLAVLRGRNLGCWCKLEAPKSAPGAHN
jgi:hypothetical protein